MTHLNSIQELPRDIAPLRDMWPDIAAQINAEVAAANASSANDRLAFGPVAPAARAPRPNLWASALAASIALLSVGFWLGRSLTAPPAVAPANAAFFDVAFVAERDRLRSDVLRRLQALPATERVRLLGSIQQLRQAVEQVQQALGQDPGNALLQELLINASQDEMYFLNEIDRATGLPPTRSQEELML
jgi:hypothetical protein